MCGMARSTVYKAVRTHYHRCMYLLLVCASHCDTESVHGGSQICQV